MGINIVLAVLTMLLGYLVAFLGFEIGETLLGTSIFFGGILIVTLGFSIIVGEAK